EISEAEIPDWLQGGMDEDTGAIEQDIFDEEFLEEVEVAPEINILDGTDTQDTWVAAFSTEGNSNLQEWYENAVAELEGGNSPADSIPTSAEVGEEPVLVQTVGAVSLEVANLPIESKLAE